MIGPRSAQALSWSSNGFLVSFSSTYMENGWLIARIFRMLPSTTCFSWSRPFNFSNLRELYAHMQTAKLTSEDLDNITINRLCSDCWLFLLSWIVYLMTCSCTCLLRWLMRNCWTFWDDMPRTSGAPVVLSNGNRIVARDLSIFYDFCAVENWTVRNFCWN